MKKYLGNKYLKYKRSKNQTNYYKIHGEIIINEQIYLVHDCLYYNGNDIVLEKLLCMFGDFIESLEIITENKWNEECEKATKIIKYSLEEN